MIDNNGMMCQSQIREAMKRRQQRKRSLATISSDLRKQSRKSLHLQVRCVRLIVIMLLKFIEVIEFSLVVKEVVNVRL